MSCGVIRSSIDEILRAARRSRSGARRRTALGSPSSSSANDVGDARGLGEDVEQVDDLLHHLAVLGDDLVLLEAGQALQAHLEDRLRLRVGQPVSPSSVQAESRSRALPAEHDVWRARARSISSTSGERQARAISAAFASGGVGAALISAMISSTLDSATARPSRMWPRSRALRSSNTVRRVTTSRRCERKLEQLLEVQQRAAGRRPARPCSCRSCPAAASACRGCSGRCPASRRASARSRRACRDLSDSSRMSEMPSMLLLADQLADALEQTRLVHLVGQLVDDDRLRVALARCPRSACARASRRGRGRCDSLRARLERRR